jgi:hypothetical protein
MSRGLVACAGTMAAFVGALLEAVADTHKYVVKAHWFAFAARRSTRARFAFAARLSTGGSLIALGLLLLRGALLALGLLLLRGSLLTALYSCLVCFCCAWLSTSAWFAFAVRRSTGVWFAYAARRSTGTDRIFRSN